MVKHQRFLNREKLHNINVQLDLKIGKKTKIEYKLPKLIEYLPGEEREHYQLIINSHINKNLIAKCGLFHLKYYNTIVNGKDLNRSMFICLKNNSYIKLNYHQNQCTFYYYEESNLFKEEINEKSSILEKILTISNLEDDRREFK